MEGQVAIIADAELVALLTSNAILEVRRHSATYQLKVLLNLELAEALLK